MSDRLNRRLRALTQPGSPSRRRPHLSLEQLEERAVPAVINVNSLLPTFYEPRPRQSSPCATPEAIQQVDTGADTTNTINLLAAGDYKITLPGTPGETDNAAGEFAVTPTAGNLSILNASGGTQGRAGGRQPLVARLRRQPRRHGQRRHEIHRDAPRLHDHQRRGGRSGQPPTAPTPAAAASRDQGKTSPDALNNIALYRQHGQPPDGGGVVGMERMR